MENLVWPVILLLVGVGLFFLEAVLPSFGIITLLGIGAVVGAVVTAFRVSTTAGVVISVIATLSIPAAVAFFFFMMKRTKIVLSGDEAAYKLPPKADEGLIGEEGVAITSLRPTGTARINGKKFDVVAEGSFIEQGRRIKVERFDGIKIVVREVNR